LIQPITVSEHLHLVAGGRRLAACLELGLDKIPAVIRKIESELDHREIELFENLHRKAMEWPEEMRSVANIHNLMKEKHGDNWSQLKTSKLLGRSRSAITDAVELSQAMDVIPELEESSTADSARKKYKRVIEEVVVTEALEEAKDKNTKKALIWAAGHYIVADINKRIGTVADGVVHFAEVDPPYGIDLKKMRKDKGEYLDTYNEIDAKDYPAFIEEVAKQVYRVLYPNAFCVWWHGPTWSNMVLGTLLNIGFKVDPIPAIWYKSLGGGFTNSPNTKLARTYEPFFVCTKGEPLLRKRGHSNVFPFAGVPPSQRIHATERPVELMQEILRTFVYPGARVLVPFLGSGNTLIACYKEGMTGFGYDLSKEHKRGFLVRVAKEFPDDFNLEEQEI
ncbi:hypothetical protein LCGC14_2665550, partial [marine sediment metagenome]